MVSEFAFGTWNSRRSKKVAQECQMRINNYRALQNRLEQILQDALANAPWREEGKSSVVVNRYGASLKTHLQNCGI